VLEGYNGTIFAYGQTGAGKTHTMMGYNDPAKPELKGITPNAFDHIFDYISQTQKREFLVRASFLEIYNEEVRDLLAKDHTVRLELKENPDSGVYVKDLSSVVVKGVKEIDHVLSLGNKNRSVGATAMNLTSSRSHSIFSIIVETSEVGPDGEQHIRAGKLNLVDLAGSERQSKTGATGQRFKEATKINMSLTTLGNVISALVDPKSSYVPYRDSKLTRLLQDSLGGNAKTVMFANCSPADYNFDETLSTLRYANRAKNIKNKPKINEDPKDAMLREFQDEIARLKKQLELASQAANGNPIANAATQLMQQQSGGGSGGGDPQVIIQPGEHTKEIQIVEKVVEKEVVREVVKGVDESVLRDLEQKTEAERASLMTSMAKTEEEKERIAAELLKRQRQILKHKQEKEALANKLKGLESKLLVAESGESIFDKAQRTEIELQRANFELEEKRRREEHLQEELQAQQEAEMLVKESYNSLAEEVDVKTKKLKKLFGKYKDLKSEMDDASSEFARDREDMLDSIRELSRQLKLKMLIIDSFIPPEEVKRIERRAEYDPERDEWRVRALELAGNNVRHAAVRPGSAFRDGSANQGGRPMSEYARVAAAQGDSNPRFRTDNVIAVQMEQPDRTTQNYDPNAVMMNVRVQANNHGAMVDDAGFARYENIPNVYFADENPAADLPPRRVVKQQRPSSSRSRRPPTATKR
jgi:kinesin family member 3B